MIDLLKLIGIILVYPFWLMFIVGYMIWDLVTPDKPIYGGKGTSRYEEFITALVAPLAFVQYEWVWNWIILPVAGYLDDIR